MIDRTPNISLHVWLDAPGIWDELRHLTDPAMEMPDELREAAEYMMTRNADEIELIGWRVLEDERVWKAINQSLRTAITEVADELRGKDAPVVSSTHAKDPQKA